MHSVAVVVWLQMQRIVVAVLYTCVVRSSIVTTVYTRPSKMSTQNVNYFKNISSAYAATLRRAIAANPHLTALSSTTVTSSCMPFNPSSCAHAAS